MTLRPGWTEEADGLWYRPPNAKRRWRGRWATCAGCSAPFPSLRTNPGTYCSAACWGRSTGGTNRATRADLFAAWTPAECWLAGLLWADGHLSRSGGKLAVMLNMADEDAVAQAAAIAGCSYGSNPQPAPRKVIHRMRFGERHAVRRLEAVGFGTKPLAWPLLPHPAPFLRGAFDGDGSVIWHQQGGRRKTAATPLRLHSTLCGTVPFLEGAQAFLTTYGIEPKKIGPNGSIWHIQWNHADSLRLAEVMYSDGGPCMQRKRTVWDRYL